MNVVKTALRSLDYIDLLATFISSMAMLTIMFAVCSDVIGRYFFHSPLEWSYDLISLYLLPVVFFFILSDTLRRNYHVAVDILYLKFSANTRLYFNLLNFLLSALLFLAIAVLYLLRSYADYVDENVISGAYNWPVWVNASFASIGTFMIFARIVVHLIATILCLRSGKLEDNADLLLRDHAPIEGTEL